MRVVAGSVGGRRLKGPPAGTRPTTGQVREAIFNSLVGLDAVAGKQVIDLFAGTGACGIEALSRGAKSCVFVDSSRQSAHVIRENLRLTGFSEQSVVTADAISYLQRARTKDVDLVIADPPYDFDQWQGLIASCDASLLVCESDGEITAPLGWEVLRNKRYGGTTVTVLCQRHEKESNV